jgi:uridine kinase
LPQGDVEIDLDICSGELEGLAVAEIEFDTVEEAEKFTPFNWFGAELTNETSFGNYNLSRAGITQKAIEDKRVTSTPDTIIPEASLTEGVSHIIEMIESRLDKVADEPVIVMVAGRTSAGKTSAVTAEIQKQFGENVSILSMDDYSKGNLYIQQVEKKEGIKINWDHPRYMDFDLVREHVQALKRGESIEKPIFSFKTGEREATESFDPNRVIIVEGLFALRDEIADLGDVKTFVDISLHGSIVRRLLRDVNRTNFGPEAILAYYLSTVEPMYQEHIAPTKANADVVLLNEYNPANEAARSGLFEVQAKFKVTDARKKLQHLGAEFLSEAQQEDHYLSSEERDFAKTGEQVRLRYQEGKVFLSYKGPRSEGSVRVRPKFEFEIDSGTALEILSRWGKDTKVVKKTREMFLYKDVIVCLDQVTKAENDEEIDLGDFVEIRTNDRSGGEEKMREVAQDLGIGYETKIIIPYFEM